MQFTFTYNHMIRGFCVAAYDGTAHIIGCSRDWHVESITLDGAKWDATKLGGAGVVRDEIELPVHDTMHPVILSYLDSDCEERIEEALIELGRGGYNTDMDEGPMQHERM